MRLNTSQLPYKLFNENKKLKLKKSKNFPTKQIQFLLRLFVVELNGLIQPIISKHKIVIIQFTIIGLRQHQLSRVTMLIGFNRKKKRNKIVLNIVEIV